MFHNLLEIFDWSKVFPFVFVDYFDCRLLVSGIFILDFSLKGADFTFFLFIHEGKEMFWDEAPTLFEELGFEGREVFLQENLRIVHELGKRTI